MQKNINQIQKFENFVIFTAGEGNINIDVLFEENTLWLTQKSISRLFEKGRTTITEHLQSIFISGELEEKVVCREFRHTTAHGAIKSKTQSVSTKYYNLNSILSVGYRVNSQSAI